MREELIKLALKVEGLSGPDRWIEGLIFKALNPDRDWVEFEDCWCAQCPDDPVAFDTPKEVTRSLDAAMSLVPTKPFPELRIGRWWWMVETWPDECLSHIAYENGDSGVPEYGGKAATPALALTAAALKARAEVQP